MKFARLTTANIVEIVLVVAVFSVLLLVSIPRLLHSQLRADVAKVHIDLKTLGDALLAYRGDNSNYFMDTGSNPYRELRLLTTPVAYVESMPTDPFRRPDSVSPSVTANYDYATTRREFWTLTSLGPDTYENTSAAFLWNGPPERLWESAYHSTNGLTSSGDLFRVSWHAPSKPQHP